MRVPSARSRLFAVLALCLVALPRAAAQDDKKKEDEKDEKAKSTSAAAAPNASQETASESSSVLVQADTTAWQTLAQNLFLSSEQAVGDPGRLEPLARHIVKFGAIQLLPKVDEEIVYDDNIFLTSDDEESGLIARTGLGMLAEYAFGGGNHHISAGYDMLRNYFIDGDARNFVEQFASGQIDLSFQHLKFAVGDRFEDRTDPVLTVQTGKIQRSINTAHALAGWHEENWYTDLRAQRATTHFRDMNYEQFDRDEDYASLELGFQTTEDVWTFLRGEYLTRTFDNPGNNDGDGVGASIGMRLRRGDELDTMVRVGVRAESFDDEFATDADDDALNVEAEARLRWWFSRSAALDGRLLRTTEFSPVSNYELNTMAELAWLQQIDASLSARAGVGIEHVNPSNTSPIFLRYTIGAGLRYALLANADLTLNYRYRTRTTDAVDGDYTNNQISLGIAIRL